MPEALSFLLAAIDQVSTEMDSSLEIHRFICKNGFVPLPAILAHFNRFSRLMVWANELTRATGKSKTKLFWFWSSDHQADTLKDWGFNLNGCAKCPFTPGQLGDGSIVYGSAPQPTIRELVMQAINGAYTNGVKPIKTTKVEAVVASPLLED